MIICIILVCFFVVFQVAPTYVDLIVLCFSSVVSSMDLEAGELLPDHIEQSVEVSTLD